MNNGIVPNIKELLALRHYASNIKLFNRQKTTLSQSGNNLSTARGCGMDFDEVRRYEIGDDIRLIHWSLTARLGKTYTKIYREERERAIYLLVDQGVSMHFGTQVCFKNVLAAKIAAIFGWSALNQQEQIGGMTFDDDYAKFIKPSRNRKSLLGLFSLLTENNKIKQQEGGLNNVLKFISKQARSGSIVIIISDYSGINQDTETLLRLIKNKCEVINVLVYDKLEASLPNKGYYTFTANGMTNIGITASRNSHLLYKQIFANRTNQIKNLSDRNRIRLIKIATTDDLVNQINYGTNKQNG